ncbi:hypothetical protein [Glycomyces rhizosphaerae]|uniref:Uncharacterized protein n=1 Tax=Glycomyces rhizosphaerae TaxID=2054422 RepID=A0ABV7PXN3_9ACTN
MLAYAFLTTARAIETTAVEPDMIPLTCNEIWHLMVSAGMPNIGWEHRLRWSVLAGLSPSLGAANAPIENPEPRRSNRDQPFRPLRYSNAAAH